MHILVVDDQSAARQFFQEFLKKWGHTVYLAENGNQAWKTLLSTTIDMVITDWMMPEMNGLELCRKMTKGSVRVLCGQFHIVRAKLRRLL